MPSYEEQIKGDREILRMERVKIAEECFELHNSINKLIGSAVIEIQGGADVTETVNHMAGEIVRLSRELAEKHK